MRYLAISIGAFALSLYIPSWALGLWLVAIWYLLKFFYWNDVQYYAGFWEDVRNARRRMRRR